MVKPKKILVIDDDRAACTMIEKTLGKRGYDVRISPDARSGYEAAKALVPDLIFINLLLPDSNGLKLSKAIHALDALRHVPVIMFVSSYGELDARYTVTIGIVDTLVKPLKEEDVVVKTAAVLGEEAGIEGAEDIIREISEEKIAPVMHHEEDEITEVEAVSRSIDELDAYQEEVVTSGAGAEDGELFAEPIREGDAGLAQHDIPEDKKSREGEEKDLFSEETDLFGDELEKSLDEVRQEPLRRLKEGSDAAGSEIDLTYENTSSSPTRRIIMIAASFVIILAIGIGGYLFFTAGNKQAPVRKEVTKVLPEPAAIPPAPLSEKPGQIPEIPVKSEAQKPEPPKAEPAPVKEEGTPKAAKPEPKKDAVQTGVPEQAAKTAAPAAGAQPEAKKPETGKSETRASSAAAAKTAPAFTVQAGIFANEANAKALAGKIREKGHTPSITSIETADKKTLYRVTIGTYANHKNAAQVSETLKKQGIQTIVRKQ